MSFVIVEKATGNAVAEIMNDKLRSKVNTDKYKAVPIAEYLTSINGKAKA